MEETNPHEHEGGRAVEDDAEVRERGDDPGAAYPAGDDTPPPADAAADDA